MAREVLAWYIDGHGNHWAAVQDNREGPWSWVDKNGRVVSLLSANLRRLPGGGAEIVDVRWSEDSRTTFSQHALAAAEKLGLVPIAERGGLEETRRGPVRSPRRSAAVRADFDFDSERDQRWIDFHDGEALDLMQGWWGSSGDPLYAIASSHGNYAWVFEDAIGNLDADIRRVKKIGRDKYQLGHGTFTGAEIDELRTIRAALNHALSASRASRGAEEARRTPRRGRHR